jgi:Rrf2 family protein
MKISKRGEYALRALIDFGIAHELGRPLMKIGELVEKERLPVKFLEQILTQLRGAGYIETKRGKAGGYYLAKPPKEIRLGSVIRLIDGPLAPISCVSVTAYERCTCPDEDHCGLRMLMLDVRNAIARILDRYVLGDIVEITLRKMRRDGVPIPFMVEQLLQPKPAVLGVPSFEENNPIGGFLAELEGFTTPGKSEPLARALPKSARKGSGPVKSRSVA